MTFAARSATAFALLILAGIGILSYRSTVREQEDRDWVTHTHLVLEKVEAILADVAQAETGQRGYLLTGQEAYLATYQDGVTQIQPDVRMFRELTPDNPIQQRAIEQLAPLLAARLEALAEGIRFRKQNGFTAAVTAASANNGAELTNQIRGQLHEMKRSEEGLLARRMEAAAVSAEKMKLVILLGNSIASLILVLASGLIYRETRRRNIAEQGLTQANERLQEQSEELSEANTELETFSYSVAHDLRAPLRQVAGYSKVLLQDHGPKLDPEAARYLEKVSDGAARMGRLVDDLLGLSKVGRQELALQATSLNGLLRQAVSELTPDWTGRQVEWQIDDLSSADCDPGLMKQVFVNLLSNAVKYTRQRERALIEVGQVVREGERVVFVRDNGAGFEMQYANKLFGVFQRLHKASDFEGTGVGLATVHRIIRKHGGRIWAEAKVNEGATFYFTLGRPGNNSNQKRPANQQEVIHVA
jgi:signal transduction histidine kinase